MTNKISRKTFLKQFSLLSLGFMGFYNMLSAAEKGLNVLSDKVSLITDNRGVLKLVKGFRYHIISEKGNIMSDDLPVPNNADGMASFKGKNGKIILIRNHEIGYFHKLGKLLQLNPLIDHKNFISKNKNNIYDLGKNNKKPCSGGTTTIVYNPKTKTVDKEYLSLAGTLVNCSGGPTPWGTWISCEETMNNKGDNGLQKNHGYNFEVIPNENIKLNKAVPLKAMGRFRHEAVAIDPKTNIAYQTEDRDDGLIYRYIPDNLKRYGLTGKLQAIAIRNLNSNDTRNWKSQTIKQGKQYYAEWIDIDNINQDKDNLRYKGKDKGASIFARPEGMWYDNDEVYFTCTSGGPNKIGQIWKYNISNHSIKLLFESTNSALMKKCDNITISPWGDIIICEDGKGVDRLIGVKPNGNTYIIAENAFNTSEFAGVNFSPDGKILFVNIYSPTMTLAIEGPWETFQI